MERAIGATDLSRRELEIARAYADGRSYREIADKLCIAPGTVRTHLAAIYRKLEISTKVELIHALEMNGSRGGKAPVKKSYSELAFELEVARAQVQTLASLLRLISRAQGEVDLIIAAVLEAALDLCDAEFGILFLYDPNKGFEANYMRGIPALFRAWFEEQRSFKPGRATGLGRLETLHQTISIVDVRNEEIYRTGDPLRIATAELGGARSFVAIPMLSRDRLIGAFTIYRQRVQPFDDQSLELAQHFAEHSVIAIENARLIAEARQHRAKRNPSKHTSDL